MLRAPEIPMRSTPLTARRALGAAALAALGAALAAAGGGETRSGPARRVDLFNGKDLSGWAAVAEPGQDATATWSVGDGVIRCAGKPRGYLRTTTAYKNYRLRLQWRWPEKPGNSGVFVHGSGADTIWPLALEAQLQAGNAGQLRANGGARFRKDSPPEERARPRSAESGERPPGEWNDYEIVCRGGDVTLSVNGVRQNALQRALLRSGWIALQSEGAPIEFRAITLEKP